MKLEQLVRQQYYIENGRYAYICGNSYPFFRDTNVMPHSQRTQSWRDRQFDEVLLKSLVPHDCIGQVHICNVSVASVALGSLSQ